MRRRSKFGSRAGQSAIFIALNLVFVFSALSLAVDLGWAYYRRAAAQTAAQMAAQSAASWAMLNGYACGENGVVCGTTYTCPTTETSPPSDELKAGCLYAAQNGFTPGGNQTVTMTSGSTTPPGSSGLTTAYWVQATVSEQSSTLFARFANMPALTIKAMATAGVTTTPSGACVYSLDPSASSAVKASGSVSVTASCGIYINSNNSAAFVTSGGAVVTSTQILVNGGASVSSNSSVSPSPTTNAGGFSDPLASLPTMTVSGCTYTNWSTSSQTTVTLSPGTYCGGISVGNQTTVNFNPGTYILNGGGLSVTGGATLNGTGVVFFNTGQNGYTASPISLSGNTTFNLSAPNTGAYQGMLFVQDRNLTYAGSNSIAGTNGSRMTGTLYFPTTNVTYSGTSVSSGTYTAIVAKTVTFSGTTYFLNDTTGTYTGLAGHAVSLL
jgi:hypothetical protein